MKLRRREEPRVTDRLDVTGFGTNFRLCATQTVTKTVSRRSAETLSTQECVRVVPRQRQKLPKTFFGVIFSLRLGEYFLRLSPLKRLAPSTPQRRRG
jgi:hypothetical protein